MGNGSAIGIGGMSVGECVKLRERQRMKEREAQRIAAAEAKAMREAAKASSTNNADGGWAQVASRRKLNTTTAADIVSSGTMSPFSRSMYAALAATSDGGKKERLVLKSSVGAAKQLKSQAVTEVADNWEEEEEKEEQEEKRREEKENQEKMQQEVKDNDTGIPDGDNLEINVAV